MEMYQLNDLGIERDVRLQFNFQSLCEINSQHEFLSVTDLSILLSTANPKKVLIVEDDPAQICILEELILEINPDTDIDWEADVTHAIKRISAAKNNHDQSSYDVVISDIALGGKSSGIDLFQYCIETQPDLKIILISAHSQKKLDEKIRKNNFNYTGPVEFMQKPIDFTIFYTVLAPLLLAG